jgi:hypothetical protein
MPFAARELLPATTTTGSGQAEVEHGRAAQDVRGTFSTKSQYNGEKARSRQATRSRAEAAAEPTQLLL